MVYRTRYLRVREPYRSTFHLMLLALKCQNYNLLRVLRKRAGILHIGFFAKGLIQTCKEALNRTILDALGKMQKNWVH